MKNSATSPGPVTILGTGSVGRALAACLSLAGRGVLAVRTSRPGVSVSETVALRDSDGQLQRTVIPTASLENFETPRGIVVVSTKAHANRSVAEALRQRSFSGPIVVLQNGLGVENPFLGAGFSQVFRGVLYMTAQPGRENEIVFRSISSCPIGVIAGEADLLRQAVESLSTPRFPFHPETDIQRQIWRKTIINSVFNSICPLLEIDNGVFARDPGVESLSREVVQEGVAIAGRLGISLDQDDVMAQVLAISRGSDGILISTLQDIQNGRPTEIESLNLALAKSASKHGMDAVRIRTLGELVLAKSRLSHA